MRFFSKNFQNYLELARFDKPAGALLLMWPCWFGVILAIQQQSGTIAESANFSWFTALTGLFYLLLFAIGSFLMRGAGCVVNDILDREIDKRVERTRNRPLASGKLTLKQAYIFLGLLLVIGFLIWICLDKTARIISFVGLGMACAYPLMKRITNYPQVFLGLTFNIGSLVGYAAIAGKLEFPAYLLYIGCIFWTVAYDTIYAHQDIEDDIKTGVKSTAISFGKWNKLIIFVCFAMFYKMVELSAKQAGASATETIFLLPTLIHMTWQILAVNLKNPQDCMAKFKSNAYVTGILVFLGLVISLTM